MSAKQRPPRPQIVLQVRERIQLTPGLVRIIAGGPEMEKVEANGSTDAYSKMLFAPADSALEPPYDMAALREELPLEQLPAVRTYTIRRFDLENGQLWVDFVVHGDSGIAGPWADQAKPGDNVVFMGFGGGYAPDPEADWHLLAGDESAIPAISSALEAMPESATGVAFIEVDGNADHLDLTAPKGVQITWLHRDGKAPGTTDLLTEAVRALPWREGRVQVFAHGERGAMKSLRPYFTDDRGLERSQMSLSAYWALGRQEDAFQAEKREPIGQV